MGGDFRRLHHQQQKTAGDAVITARRSDVVEGNVQRITQDRHQTSSALHGTRSRQDLLGDAARRSDQNTSSAAHSRQTKLRDATKMYESSQQHLASLNTSPVVSTTTLTPAPSAESVPTAQSQFRQSVTHGGDSPLSNQPRRDSTGAHDPIRRPPKFDGDRYGRYKEEIALWADAHPHAYPHALTSELALSDEGACRIVMMNCILTTKSGPKSRSFESLFFNLGEEYLRDASERPMRKLQQHQAFFRGPREAINSLWI